MLKLHSLLTNAVLSSFILFATISAAETVQSDVIIEQAWVRSTLAVQKTSAMYLKVNNRSKKTLSILGAEVEGVGHTMLHKTVEKNGMASM
ncbi:MAG: copper chaperone PCu(A)C, partial [Kangiellaceae bacterium]|nr:copper chaperone PCu(A)C [Kangiellaceae bacterium]